MVDEAHCTQYGILGARMSKALPKATLDRVYGHAHRQGI